MIVWYIQNKDRVLSHCDRGLMDQDWSIIHRMSRTRRAWIVKCLNTAKGACENERRQAAKNQNVITKFFSKKVEGQGRRKPEEKKPGVATGEAKRSRGGDGRVEAASRVLEEGRPAEASHRGEGEGLEETDDPETAREVSESKSGDS